MTGKSIKAYDFITIMLITIACSAVSLAVAGFIRYGTVLGSLDRTDYQSLLSQMVVISLIENLGFDFNRHFFRRNFPEEIRAVISEELIFVLGLLLWMYMIHDSLSLSRLLLLYYVLIDCVLLYLSRQIFKQVMQKYIRTGSSSSRLLIVATLEGAGRAVSNILSYNEWYRTIVGVAILDKNSAVDDFDISTIPPVAEGVRVVADRGSFMDYVVHNEVDEILVMDEQRKYIDTIVPWAQVLEEMGIAVSLNIDLFDLGIGGKKSIEQVGKYAVVSFRRNEISARQAIAKRLLDIAGSLVGCLMLAVISIFLVPAIRLESPGPALFRQKRVGKNGRIFTLYKFRSMYQDAEERKAALMAQNEMKGLMFKMDDDPRVTRVGAFIRKTSLDEFPQFINVLKGDMSLVGTRPPTVDEYERYEARHKCRISMKPGITGMWQVSGRSEIKDFDEVIRLDMEYIDNWSIAKDIRILIKTVGVVLLGRGSV